MTKKTYSPEGKDNILMSNIMLHADGQTTELHIGGIVSFDDLIKRADFWKYLKTNIDKEIQVDMNSYCLYGETGITRNATLEEMEVVIDDDFPNSPVYAQHLRGEDNESNFEGYIIRPVRTDTLSNEISAFYTPVGCKEIGGLIREEHASEQNKKQLPNKFKINMDDIKSLSPTARARAIAKEILFDGQFHTRHELYIKIHQFLIGNGLKDEGCSIHNGITSAANELQCRVGTSLFQYNSQDNQHNHLSRLQRAMLTIRTTQFQISNIADEIDCANATEEEFDELRKLKECLNGLKDIEHQFEELNPEFADPRGIMHQSM